MTQKAAPCDPPAAKKIDERRHTVLGIRMTTERAREVKVEAAKRSTSVAKLFEEVWQVYCRSENQ
jgi:hypothetical protein